MPLSDRSASKSEMRPSEMTSPHRRRMQAVRRQNTDIELMLRRELWFLGVRYRCDYAVEGCRPDIVFPAGRLAVFVDGCWWHGCPLHFKQPKSNADFWTQKIARNCERDIRDVNLLSRSGWSVMRFWECEIRNAPALTAVRVVEALGDAFRLGVPG